MLSISTSIWLVIRYCIPHSAMGSVCGSGSASHNAGLEWDGWEVELEGIPLPPADFNATDYLHGEMPCDINRCPEGQSVDFRWRSFLLISSVIWMPVWYTRTGMVKHWTGTGVMVRRY